MVYTGTIATEAEIAVMAGELVDATGNTEANRNLLMAQVESFLSNFMRYNVVDNFGTLNNDLRRILSEYAARYCGMTLIAYNMAGFTTRTEAEDMINIHAWRMEKIEAILKEQRTETFLTEN